MSFKFDVKKSVHVLLFVIQSLGGKADLYKLFLIIYFADLKHLAKYGTYIIGDTYIAMKYGPVPFNILSIYKQLKGEGFAKSHTDNLKEYFILNHTQEIEAITEYNQEYISQSEAECLFETIQLYKNTPYETLVENAKNSAAWQLADRNGEISLHNMAKASGSSEDMIQYIETAFENELNSFNENAEA